MLDTFKVISGCDDDTLANYYINKAKQNIKKFTKRNNKTIETELNTFVIDLAISYYNKRGAEGLQSQSYSGASEIYTNDIPDDIKTCLVTYRRFKQEKEVE